MIRRPPRSTRTYTLFPYTTLFRSVELAKSNNCLACHQVDKKRVGPAFNVIAQRFAGQEGADAYLAGAIRNGGRGRRSEEHTSELQSLMRISYAVFCLKKKKKQERLTTNQL